MVFLETTRWQDCKGSLSRIKLVDLRNRIKLRKIFKESICKECGLCTSTMPNPSFCMDMYEINKDRFLNILRFIMALKKSRPETYKSLCSFEAFCGLFCNSKPVCSKRTKECEDLLRPIACFTDFSCQRGLLLPQNVHLKIWEKFYGTETNKIGKKYSTNTDPLRGFPKSTKKEVKRTIRKLKRSASVSRVAYAVEVEKKEVTTEFFCSDDKKWEEQVKLYLKT